MINLYKSIQAKPKAMVKVATSVTLMMTLFVFSTFSGNAQATIEQPQIYSCPMHPEQTSHEAGRCAVCNMFLTQANSATSEQDSAHSGHDHTAPHAAAPRDSHQADIFNQVQSSLTEPEQPSSIKYVCPMHAHIISDDPSSCPICGMDLEPVETGGNLEELQIQVSGSIQQALAIKVAEVKRGMLWKYVQTVGHVDYDESQIQHIHSRVSGWIEKLKVSAIGDKITKGDLLYELYSPDLINAQDDYLLALDTLNRSANNGNYQDLVRRSQLRLELLGMTKPQIEQLAKNQKTLYKVPFYATQDGIVQNLSVRDGMYIQPMTEVMSLVDLSKVWVIADVFENEQSWLTLGQPAEVSIPAMNLTDIEGKIDYIYPELDPMTRSLRVRIVLNNNQAELRPNTLAKVSLYGGAKRGLLIIPQEALIQTGQENRVIVKQSDNSFVARQVSLGMLSQGKAEIVSGLSEGEQVVLSGQFLLDSEASLKGSLMRLSSGHEH